MKHGETQGQTWEIPKETGKTISETWGNLCENGRNI